jgi:ankyrin repeat protein
MSWTYIPLRNAVYGGDLEVVKYLVEKGANIGESLRDAAMKNHVDIARFLLERGGTVNRKDKYGNTPLTTAAALGHMEMVKLLLDKGARVGHSLVGAAGKGNLDLVKLLVEKGAKINGVNKKGETALMAASMRSRMPVVRYLVKEDARVNQKDLLGRTALMHASLSLYGAPRAVEYLLDHGADPNARTKRGVTALMFLARKGYTGIYPAEPWIESVALLLHAGVKTNVKDRKGRTALDIARKKKKKVRDIIRLLEQAEKKK